MTFHKFPEQEKDYKFYYITFQMLDNSFNVGLMLGDRSGDDVRGWMIASSYMFLNSNYLDTPFRRSLVCDDIREAKVKIIIDHQFDGYDFRFTDPFTVTQNGRVCFRLDDPELVAKITAQMITA